MFGENSFWILYKYLWCMYLIYIIYFVFENFEYLFVEKESFFRFFLYSIVYGYFVENSGKIFE